MPALGIRDGEGETLTGAGDGVSDEPRHVVVTADDAVEDHPVMGFERHRRGVTDLESHPILGQAGGCCPGAGNLDAGRGQIDPGHRARPGAGKADRSRTRPAPEIEDGRLPLAHVGEKFEQPRRDRAWLGESLEIGDLPSDLPVETPRDPPGN
jgi:hypothetical protein